MDEPGVLPRPPLGEALPVEEDKFLEGLQPDETVGYGDVSSTPCKYQHCNRLDPHTDTFCMLVQVATKSP